MTVRLLAGGALILGLATTAAPQPIDAEAINRANLGACYVIEGADARTGEPIQSSGCAVDIRGLILTSAHGVYGVNKLIARHPEGWSVPAAVLTLDRARDIAIIQTEKALPAVVALGTAGPLANGSPLVAIASPRGLDFTVSTGIVANGNLTLEDAPMIQTDLLSEPGSSGGPVFSRGGKLAGIIKGRIDGIQGTLVTPIDTAYHLLKAQGVAVPAVKASGNRQNAEQLVTAEAGGRVSKAALAAFYEGVQASASAAKIAAYTRAVEADPEFFQAWFNLGVAHGQAQAWPEAIVAYRKAVALRPNSVPPNRNLGLALLRTGAPAEAAAHFERITGLQPDSARAYNDLGEALRQAKRLQDAEQAFRRALERDGTYAPAHYNLGLTLSEAGQRDTAAEAFQLYLDCAPDAPDAAKVRAWIAELTAAKGM